MPPSPKSSATFPVTKHENNEKQEKKECLICMDEKPAREMFRTMRCSHRPIFCSECIGKYIATKVIEGNILPVKCPDVRCKVVLEPHFCRSVVPKEVLDRWSSTFDCPFEDCRAVLVVDKVVSKFKCYTCHRLLCAQCKVSWHGGTECTEHIRKLNKQNDSRLQRLAWTMKWRRCPGCYIYVERTHGCRYIICRCGCGFCYECGFTRCSCYDDTSRIGRIGFVGFCVFSYLFCCIF